MANHNVDNRLIGLEREVHILMYLARFRLLSSAILTAFLAEHHATGRRMIQRSLRRLLDRGEIVVNRTRDAIPVYGIAKRGAQRLRDLDMDRWMNIGSSVDFIRQACKPFGQANHRLMGAGLINQMWDECLDLRDEYEPYWDDLSVAFATEEEIQRRPHESPLALAGIGANGRRADGVFAVGTEHEMEGFLIEAERSNKPRRSFDRMISLITFVSESQTLGDRISANGCIIGSQSEKYLKAIHRRLEKDSHPAKECVIYRLGGPLEWQVWPENGKTIADLTEWGDMAQSNLQFHAEYYDNSDDEEEEDLT